MSKPSNKKRERRNKRKKHGKKKHGITARQIRILLRTGNKLNISDMENFLIELSKRSVENYFEGDRLKCKSCETEFDIKELTIVHIEKLGTTIPCCKNYPKCLGFGRDLDKVEKIELEDLK